MKNALMVYGIKLYSPGTCQPEAVPSTIWAQPAGGCESNPLGLFALSDSKSKINEEVCVDERIDVEALTTSVEGSQGKGNDTSLNVSSSRAEEYSEVDNACCETTALKTENSLHGEHDLSLDEEVVLVHAFVVMSHVFYSDHFMPNKSCERGMSLGLRVAKKQS